MDTEKLRAKFTDERAAVQSRIEEIQGDERQETAQGETDSAHLWEEADIRDASLDQATRKLEAIDGVLQRLDQGTYGICEGCGKPIPEARLEAMPYASTCVACAEV